MAILASLRHHLDRLTAAFTHRGLLSQSDITQHLRHLRIALLEEEVALSVVKDLIDRLNQEASAEVLNSANAPGLKLRDMIQEALTAMLDLPGRGLSITSPAPTIVMMVGLQGSGKTTTTAKLAAYFRHKKTLMVSLDVYRPAAAQQLAALGQQIGVDVMTCSSNTPLTMAHEAVTQAKIKNYDILMLDTAGRRHIDEMLMAELVTLVTDVKPHETLLVVDSLMGQGALTMADHFKGSIPLTGIILTRLDAEGPCGAALSVTATTRVPIKFIGTGEHIKDLELFDPKQLVRGVMGHGDMKGLVEKLSEALPLDDIKTTELIQNPGRFELQDYRHYLEKFTSMGGLSFFAKYLPSALTPTSSPEADKSLRVELALLHSMTRQELSDHRLLNFKRKQRILKGSGRQSYELNRLIKKFLTLRTMMKKAAIHAPSQAASGGKKTPWSISSSLKSFFTLDERKKHP